MWWSGGTPPRGCRSGEELVPECDVPRLASRLGVLERQQVAHAGQLHSDSPVSARVAPPTTTGGLMPDARDVILKHIAAVNDRDSDADPWAADAELVAPGGQASGRGAVIAFLGVFQEAFPDLRLEIKQLLTDGPAAAAEGTLAGTHDGVLHTPDGDVPPTGRAVELRWAAVYVTDGDTLKSEHLFFDQMDFLGQLGLLPA